MFVVIQIVETPIINGFGCGCGGGYCGHVNIYTHLFIHLKL